MALIIHDSILAVRTAKKIKKIMIKEIPIRVKAKLDITLFDLQSEDVVNDNMSYFSISINLIVRLDLHRI
jgi:hypothetical protein